MLYEIDIGTIMAFSYRDAKKLASQVWQQDEILYKKRRWLAKPYVTSTADGSQKKFRRPKVLNDVFLAESFVRNDEVSYETVKFEVGRSFGAYNGTHKTHHVAHVYFKVFETFDKETYSSNPSHLNKLYPLMNALNNKALCHVTSFITNNSIQFEKTRPKMIETLQHHLPRLLENSSIEDIQNLMKKLSDIFKDPCNFQEKQLSLHTPITPSLLLSIQNAIALIDDMPLQDLIAMNRKLNEVKVVLKFPLPKFGRKRDDLVNIINRRCQRFLANLRDDTVLPEPFAKALSVVQLSLKQRTKSLDIFTSEFYPFSPEVVGLQNDMLGALWLLEKIQTRELKKLQHYVDPEGNIPIKAFRNSLSKYLLEILFECDLIDIPDDVLYAIAALNRRSGRKARLFTKELLNEDVEGVLAISSQLKRIVLDSYENEVESFKSNDYCQNNDFDLADDSYVNASMDHEETQSCFYDNAEGTGDSNGFIYMDNDIKFKMDNTEQSDNMDFMASDISKKNNLKGGNENTSQHLSAEEGNPEMRNNLVQEICDETSLVAYKLIGHMLDKFIHANGGESNEMTRNYLRGGSSLESQDVELSKSSMETNSKILTESLQVVLPNMSKSCLEKVKKLMDC